GCWRCRNAGGQRCPKTGSQVLQCVRATPDANACADDSADRDTDADADADADAQRTTEPDVRPSTLIRATSPGAVWPPIRHADATRDGSSGTKFKTRRR